MKLFTWVQTNDYISIITVSNTWNYLTVYKHDYNRIISVSNTWNYLTVCKQMIILELLVLVILESI